VPRQGKPAAGCLSPGRSPASLTQIPAGRAWKQLEERGEPDQAHGSAAINPPAFSQVTGGELASPALEGLDDTPVPLSKQAWLPALQPEQPATTARIERGGIDEDLRSAWGALSAPASREARTRRVSRLRHVPLAPLRMRRGIRRAT
jgi:hypothetical protein